MTSAYSSLFLLIYLIIPIVMLISGIIAHRGKAFWATWLMIIGASGVFLAIVTMAAAMFFALQNLAGPSTTGVSSMSTGIIISIIGSLCGLGGLIAYGAGLMGLCVRWGPTAKRAAELEELTASLLSERSQAPQ